MSNPKKTIITLSFILVFSIVGVVSSQTTTPETILEEIVAVEEVVIDNEVASSSAFVNEVEAVVEVPETVIEEEGIVATTTENNTTELATSTTSESLEEALVIQSEVEDFVVDLSATNTPPFVSILSPTDARDISGVITISATANDKETGVAGVQFFLDGKELGPPISKAPYQILNWYSTGTPNGTHTFTALAYDTEGKTAESNLVVTFANDEADIKLPLELPPEPSLVLQASGGPASKVKAGSIKADVVVENVSSCKLCKNTSPEVAVQVYVTPWYPNDGPQSVETAVKYAGETYSVPSLKSGEKNSISWSGSFTSGKYYFVTVVDPENTLDTYRVTRSIFEVQ